MGRQLAILKRIYQSYDLIIGRILERQKKVIADAIAQSTPSSPNVSNLQSLASSQITEAYAGHAVDDAAFAVPLSAAASVRFERLKDRINLYALSEIQDCLDEKETLTNLVIPSQQFKVSTCILIPTSELQSHNPERIPICRKTHPLHHHPHKRHSLLPTR